MKIFMNSANRLYKNILTYILVVAMVFSSMTITIADGTNEDTNLQNFVVNVSLTNEQGETMSDPATIHSGTYDVLLSYQEVQAVGGVQFPTTAGSDGTVTVNYAFPNGVVAADLGTSGDPKKLTIVLEFSGTTYLISENTYYIENNVLYFTDRKSVV